MNNAYEDEIQSKYCYKGTNILINKFNIMDEEKLSQVEADITYMTTHRLINKPVYGKFDLKHLQDIHKTIFSKIYPFAGKIRDEEIGKGGVWFALPQYIKPYADDLFKKLKKKNA